VAAVTGDDLAPRLPDLLAAGHEFVNLDTGEPLGIGPVMVANAYLGGWGIAEALDRGADIVVTGPGHRRRADGRPSHLAARLGA
jgi:hypothetical protein